jgi:putative ABC transport system permease protein
MIEFLKSSFRNLGRKFLRTFLTIFGIAIGVASVILIANISQCGTNALSDEMESLGMSGLTITASANNPEISLDENDLSVIQKLNSVAQAAPVVTANSNIAVRNVKTQAILWGIDAKAADIVSLQVLYGRFLNRNDLQSNSNVCLVDQAFSKSAYSRDNIIGKKILVQCAGVWQEFTVIGIVKTGTGLLQNFIDSYIPTFIYVPYTTLQNFSGRRSFDEIAVKIRKGDDADNVGQLIVNCLDSNNGVSNAFVSNNLAHQKDGLTHILDIVTLILSAVGAISLFVASLSIMTVMLVSVNERMREIGIKKALGATRWEIMLEFLFEAVLISLIGCLAGIIGGYLISFAGASYFHTSFGFRPDIMLLASGFSILSGTVFGVYPAYKAACLKPVDALRQE